MNINDLVYALIICLFGMTVVFVILVGLSFMTSALSILSNKDSKKDKGRSMQANEELQPDEYVLPETEAKSDDEELIAVISAAVAVCTERENNLVVKSIRRVEDCTPVWGKVSRQEQMLNRL